MEYPPLNDIEELALCSCCQLPFDDDQHLPKILDCKHHFCLACVGSMLGSGREARCMHCWKRTDLPGGRATTLPTHGAVLALALRLLPVQPELPDALAGMWCGACDARALPDCSMAHAVHTRPAREALALLQREAHGLAADAKRLANGRRDLLLRALDAATALKVRLEAELVGAPPAPTLRPCATPEEAAAERERLRASHADALLQARLDHLVRTANVPLELEPLRAPPPDDSPTSPDGEPLLLLANYCTAALYLQRRRTSAADGPAPARPLSPYPLFYFSLEVNCVPCGRVVVEVRDDAAPRMSRNFGALATGELGVGYRGCAVFQCWGDESVITGDYEQNNGRGGRSALEEAHFMPDDTRLAAVRGAVGMRRSQKRHDNFGLVGSQFRIMLREMRGFTAIFAFVVEGLELVDRLSRTGDGAGKPHSSIMIAACGRLN